MTGKIFRAIAAATAGILLACTAIILGCLYEYFDTLQTQQLWAELEMAAIGVETAGSDYLASLSPENNRLTWIAADGNVLFDGQADYQSMENHADREEVLEAKNSGTGTSVRQSETLLEKTIYCAKRLSDGSVLRISVSRASLVVLAVEMLQPICVIVFFALIFAFVVANHLANRIVEPLNSLDLEHPLENQTYDELAPLLKRINQQRIQIHAQLLELQQKKEEFAQITASMNEGLVLLDNKGFILSINPAAQSLFHADSSTIGQDFLTLERSCEIRDAIRRAEDSGHSEITLERNGRTYQVDMSRTKAEENQGIVLLIFDVTDKVDAERTRREFTANVSHELKTPLTAILGSSELLQSGVIKNEDIPRFVGHIHKEASRLLTLIQDIIRLSQLDEGVAIPKETVDLSEIANEAVDQLREKAEQCHVTLWIQAEPCLVQGVPRLYHEIIYNLTENAIKYNVENGHVQITVDKNGLLTVADSGIGIPQEDQERVFERFYRVDKSHSKAIGGTGLGLSIVKHAAAYLGASIALQSKLGKGTTIQVSFLRKED